MNISSQKITVGLALALSLSLISCEKDNLLTPESSSKSARLGAVDDFTLPSPKIPQVPRLVKYGNSTLSYSDYGQLQKVTTSVPRGFTPHTDYTYAPGSIRAASYEGNSLVRDETFILDASGRCTESVIKGTPNDTHWIYTYNAKGQLWSCQKQNTCVGGTSYTYNADGDVVQATVATSALDAMVVTFAYVLPMDTNYYYETYALNLNAPVLPEHDTFLRIFGKTGKHLVKGISYAPSGSTIITTPSDRFYAYVIKSDGYVTERNTAYTFGGSSIEKTVYKYELADITVN